VTTETHVHKHVLQIRQEISTFIVCAKTSNKNFIIELELKDNLIHNYFVNVSIFKHLRTTITKKNEVNHEIKR
jgi:hypothetical protein